MTVARPEENVSVLAWQCRCCIHTGKWWLWPHAYAPPLYLSKSPDIRWRIWPW